MKVLLDQLITDHEHILRLLSCLEQALKGYGSEGEEQGEKLANILDALGYLNNYPDSFHHPLEARLLARLRPKVSDPDLCFLIEEIEQEHETIHTFTISLIERFKAISRGESVPIRELLTEAHLYIELQRQHIQTENRVMIPALQVYLGYDDFLLVEHDINTHPDPVFGAQGPEVYEALYELVVNTSIAHEKGADRGF